MRKFVIVNPVNLVGNNVTIVIAGIEAAEEVKTAEDGTGDEIQLVDRNGQEICYAEVLDKWGGPLGHVPAMLLEMNQDPLQRVFTGLHTHLMILAQKPVMTMELISVLVIRPKINTLIRPTGKQVIDIGKKVVGAALRKSR